MEKQIGACESSSSKCWERHKPKVAAIPTASFLASSSSDEEDSLELDLLLVLLFVFLEERRLSFFEDGGIAEQRHEGFCRGKRRSGTAFATGQSCQGTAAGPEARFTQEIVAGALKKGRSSHATCKSSSTAITIYCKHS